jgi:hypothetical protein
MWMYPDTEKQESTSTKLFYKNNATQALLQEGERQQAQSWNNYTGNTTNWSSPSPPNNNSSCGNCEIRGTLGDIMSPSNSMDENDQILFRDGLVTKESQSLAQAYQIHNPLDRMAITANGNLQRLFSSYYDTPVTVQVEYCRQRQQSHRHQQQQLEVQNSTTISASVAAIWERQVLLQIFNNQTFCTATSLVVVHQEQVEQLIESGVVGIGQLFRHFNVLPEFALVTAGPTSQGGFWRNYTLTSDQLITCHIHEVFCPNVWNLKPWRLSNNLSIKGSQEQTG